MNKCYIEDIYNVTLHNDSNANTCFRMISCATEDYGNDAEHLAMITGINTILKCIETENS